MRDETMERRKFLSTFSAAGLALLGGAAAFIGAGFLYPVPRRRRPAQFICLDGDIPPGGTRKTEDPRGRTVLLLRRPDGRLMAIGTVCTHLGCAVYYREKKKVFECPCHAGFFDAEGNPVSGPPQRPLDRYPVEVRDGKVFVQFA